MQSLTLLLLVVACQAQVYYLFNNFFETAPGSSDCPPNYQVIKDSKACEQVAGLITNKYWGAIYHYYPVNPFPDGCTTRAANDVNYYVNPAGVHTDPSLSVLCINKAAACSNTDGTGVSTGYPCACGTATCATNEICIAAQSICEVAQGYYETERKANACPSGYQTITDQGACKEAAGLISGKDWGAVYSFTTVPHGCSTWTTHVVNYYVNPNGPVNVNPQGTNTEVDIALLCIRSSMTCDVSDGSGVSSSYPCACGTDTCASNEICIESQDLCEVIPGYYEAERGGSTCPDGYQPIRDAAACQDVAGLISGMNWGFAYDFTTGFHGCGTQLDHIINYYVNPGGTNTDVDVAMLCMNSSSMACDKTDGSGPSSTYPCVCGTDVCANGELCREAENQCQILTGYVESERKANACPGGYIPIFTEYECSYLATLIPDKTWMPFKDYSAVATGCGTWKENTVNFFSNPGGTNEEVRMALLCKTIR